MTEIAGKNVLVTGGASGIGRQMAKRIARRGGNVILWDIHEGNLARVQEELKRDTDESLRMELRQTAPGVKTTVVCPFFIDTGMFDGAKTRFSFLLPILKEEDVAEKVVEAIEHNRARLFMPPMVHVVPPMRLLPVGVFDFVADFLGVNSSMEEFKGRGEQGRRS